MRDSLAADVVFHPPLQFRPFVGRDTVAAVLSIPAIVFAFSPTFRYSRVLSDGQRHALFFEAELPSGRRLEGVDYIHTDHDGLVDELRVMLRPIAQIQEFEEHAKRLIMQLNELGQHEVGQSPTGADPAAEHAQ